MRKFIYRILKIIPTKYVTSGFILIILLFIYGIVGSHYIMHLNLINSVYYAVITMATVGYGDYTPNTGIQKIFATTLALAGVALLAYVFNVILTNFQEKIREYSKGANIMKAIEDMEDYYVLCGYGRVGKVVLEELKQRQQNVIIIDKDAEVCSQIEKSKKVVVINENATENNIISRLIGPKCKSAILSTGDDVTNIFIVLTIRESNPDVWIVSRASKIENFNKLKNAGANKIVSPEITGGQELYLESARPHYLRVTVRHEIDKSYEEFEIIMKHKCSLEDIAYHIPGIETPLTREIQTMNLSDGKEYRNHLKENDTEREALENLYSVSHNIHSHLIAGSDKNTFDKLIKDLEKHEEIIGINLTDEEIAEITKKEIK